MYDEEFELYIMAIIQDIIDRMDDEDLRYRLEKASGG